MTDNLPPLLPCPFCGNEKNIAMANEKHNHSGGYFIACPACDASTGLRYACGEDPRPLLVEQWNRRAAIAQAQSCVPAELAPLPAASPETKGVCNGCDECTDYDDEAEEPECPRCHGDGGDPWNDYILPCPVCQGERP
jgi:Lar family restriction alleviation protein